MKPLTLALLSFVLAHAAHGQDVTKPIIPAPAPPAQTPGPVLVPTPLPAQTPDPQVAPASQTPAPPSAPGAAAPGATPAPGIAPATGTGAGVVKPVVSPTYVIGPRDGLSITVWKETNLSGNVEVRPDGMISMSLLGDIKAVDFTPTQLADDITNRLKKYITEPLVTVTVLAINSKNIFFTGEGIGHPGEMLYNPNISTLQAIISAGGINMLSNGKHIYVLRTVNGKPVKIPFDYKKAVKTGDQQGVTLQPGDTIVVP